MGTQRSTLIGVGLTCLLATGLLAWPLFGDPPYGFYGLMKLVVAFASGIGAWALWELSKGFLPLSVLLAASGGLELLGKMRRADWVPFNWASLVLLGLAGAICLVAAGRATELREGDTGLE